jgi:cytosine/adenosine deaminase-related metal-dependent hydrolase
VYLRGGTMAPYQRFASAGVRTAIGTDSPSMDMLGELRAAGFVSKLWARASDVATAHTLLEAATVAGADALGRTDLGRIAPGARGDLLVVDLDAPHLRSAADPIRSTVWYATAADIRSVVVDGEVLVHDGRFTRGDEAAIAERGRLASQRVWDLAERQGLRAHV